MKASDQRTGPWPAGALVVAWAVLWTGCATPPAPVPVLTPPPLVVETSLAPGDLFGRTIEPRSEEPLLDESRSSVPLRMRCRLLYLKSPRTKGLGAAASSTSIVADLSGATPVLPTPQLTLSALVAEGRAAEEWIADAAEAASNESFELESEMSFVPPGSTYRMTARAFDFVEDPRDWLDEFPDRGPFAREVTLALTAGAQGPVMSLVLRDLDPNRETELKDAYLADPSVQATPPPPVQDELVRSEALELRCAPAPGSPVVVHLASPYTKGNGTSMAFVVELLGEEEGAAAPAGALDTALEALRAAASEQSAQRAPLTDETRAEIEQKEALDVFRTHGGRAALLAVAQESGAPLAAELAIVADLEFLGQLRDAALSEDAPESPSSKERLGWEIDRAAWKLLAQGALDETLDDELKGLLLRQAGALASFPDIVQDAAKLAADQEDFRRRLIKEQRYFLEDASPAARLRAWDWLVELGLGIDGYDPLGERGVRRAALEAAASATDMAAAGAETPEEDSR